MNRSCLLFLSALLFTITLSGCGTPSAAVPREDPAPTQSQSAQAPTTQDTTAQATTAQATATGEPLLFSGEAALHQAQRQCDIGPRPTGSEALLQTRDLIEAELQAHGWQTIRQDFEYQAPNSQVRLPIHNIVGIKGEGQPLMVGAHFDTRPRADQDPEDPNAQIIGGNDGASGVAVMLELARTVEIPAGRQVQLAFFDAEDRGGIDGWPFSVGAEHMATNLPGARPHQLVVLDMIGDADQQIFRERNSDIALNDEIFAIAAELGYEGQGFYNQPKWTIIDDHLPFIRAGIPAIDLIDFDYPAWHTLDDTCDKLGIPSLERVGRVVEVWLERSPAQTLTPTPESTIPVPTATAEASPSATPGEASPTPDASATPEVSPSPSETPSLTLHLPLIAKGANTTPDAQPTPDHE